MRTLAYRSPYEPKLRPRLLSMRMVYGHKTQDEPAGCTEGEYHHCLGFGDARIAIPLWYLSASLINDVGVGSGAGRRVFGRIAITVSRSCATSLSRLRRHSAAERMTSRVMDPCLIDHESSKWWLHTMTMKYGTVQADYHTVVRNRRSNMLSSDFFGLPRTAPFRQGSLSFQKFADGGKRKRREVDCG